MDNPITQQMGQQQTDAERKARKEHVQRIREVVDDLLTMGRKSAARISTENVKLILDELDAVTIELMEAQDGWDSAAAQIATMTGHPGERPTSRLDGRIQLLEARVQQQAKRIQELDIALAKRLLEILELRKQTRHMPQDTAEKLAGRGFWSGKLTVDCTDSLDVVQLADLLGEPAVDVQEFLEKTRWPVHCPDHGIRIPEDMVPILRSTYDSWLTIKGLLD